MHVMAEVSRLMLANASGAGWCLLSRSEIGAELGVQGKVVGNAIATLRDRGLIETSGHGTATIYRVLFSEPVEARRKPVPNEWPEARLRRLLDMRARGLSLAACAQRLNTSRAAVAGKLRRNRDKEKVPP